MTDSICPYTSTCIIYKNWTEKTGDRRVNVIRFKGSSEPEAYCCLAFDAHNGYHGEGRITFSQEIRDRIETPQVKTNSLHLGDVRCSHLTLLTKLNSLAP